LTVIEGWWLFVNHYLKHGKPLFSQEHKDGHQLPALRCFKSSGVKRGSRLKQSLPGIDLHMLICAEDLGAM
jgi:hypothetical protein